ncbi:MAG: hypothetical protein HZB53_22500 [Chloroflexi bacterium]|nr:hypothetical protein [Chloroflexota bacterium]
MARPKKFEDPHNITFTLDYQELEELKLVAHEAREPSLSAFIRAIVMFTIRRRRRPPAEDETR